MNIMLNNYCNLNCSYCFVNKNVPSQNISSENLDYYIDFLKKSKYHKLRLIGGEPTLHNDYCQIIKTYMNDVFFDRIDVFTNGLWEDNNILISSEKLYYLINYNSAQVIGLDRFNKITKNIKNLIQKFESNNISPQNHIFLGVNLYSPNQDIDYIVNAIRDFGLKALRYSIVVPKTVGQSISIKSYQDFIPLVLNLLRKCKQYNIIASIDCNNIPKCCFSNEDLIELSFLNFDIINKNICNKVFDVDPLLNVTRCMPFFSLLSCNLKDYNNINEISNFFNEKIDNLRFKKFTFNECSNCKWFLKSYCQGGCLTYKFDKI